jgi:hypothetical protein
MLPKYKPQQWVIFTVNSMRYLGQITNAAYGEFNGKSEWRYSVTMPSGNTQSAAEGDITHYFDGNSYVDVNNR